jgi:hypothetical protein
MVVGTVAALLLITVAASNDTHGCALHYEFVEL